MGVFFFLLLLLSRPFVLKPNFLEQFQVHSKVERAGERSHMPPRPTLRPAPGRARSDAGHRGGRSAFTLWAWARVSAHASTVAECFQCPSLPPDTGSAPPPAGTQ